MNHPLILSESALLMGKPVIAGTHITVESILLRLAAGETIAQLLAVPAGGKRDPAPVRSTPLRTPISPLPRDPGLGEGEEGRAGRLARRQGQITADTS